MRTIKPFERHVLSTEEAMAEVEDMPVRRLQRDKRYDPDLVIDDYCKDPSTMHNSPRRKVYSADLDVEELYFKERRKP
ncbi:hypothetical protein ACFL0V_01365 [Nanoarchaeota archaeon]